MHQTYMQKALELARNGLYSADPNPRVGCVITQDNKIIAQGYHAKTGQSHAEINALNACQQSPKGGTAYVTLEPCSHYGRTPPCTQALIAAGITQVYIAIMDPNPRVCGQGIKQLIDAGIKVSVGLLEQQASQLNIGFIKRMTKKRPFIRLKSAISLDGRTAMASGESQWVTGPMARQAVQRIRARSSAIVTGINTVIRDNARLSVRTQELGLNPAQCTQMAVDTITNPMRLVLDGRSQSKLAHLSADHPFFTEPGEIQFIIQESHRTLIDVGAPFFNDRVGIKVLSDISSTQDQLPALLDYLNERQCNEVLIEAGPTLIGEFIRHQLFDEWVIFVAPKLLGSNAKPLAYLEQIDKMAQSVALTIDQIKPIGEDWCILAYPKLSDMRSDIMTTTIVPDTDY